MRKKLFATLLALSMLLGSSLVASASVKIPIPWGDLIKVAYEIWKDRSSGTKCATEISSSNNEVLKCMPNGGCQWVSGSSVNWGGQC